MNLLTAPLFVLFFLAMFVRWATTFGAHVAAVASVAAAVGIAFGDSLGLPRLSMMWILPGSFGVGVTAGALASLFPIGQSSKLCSPAP